MQQPLSPSDYVVMAKPQAVTADRKTLRASLDQHFQRLSQRTAPRNG
jgi:RNase P protein component